MTQKGLKSAWKYNCYKLITHIQQMVALPGSQTTHKLHQWGGVVVVDTPVDVNTHLVDTVDKLQV